MQQFDTFVGYELDFCRATSTKRFLNYFIGGTVVGFIIMILFFSEKFFSNA